MLLAFTILLLVGKGTLERNTTHCDQLTCRWIVDFVVRTLQRIALRLIAELHKVCYPEFSS